VRFLPWRKKEAKPKAAITQVPWDLTTFIGPHGIEYPLFGQSLIGNQEHVGQEFLSFVQHAYKGSPIVFACVMNRMLLFSEARFLFREIVDGRPGDYFTDDEALAPLKRPWPNGNTGDLLSLAEVHVSCAGNFFAVRRPNDYIKVMRPDWVTIVLGSMQDEEVDADDIDAEVIGYMYNPGGNSPLSEVEMFFPEEVAHYMPMPDPECPYRGMSWITPVIQEMLADKEMTSHKRKFLEAGATPNLAVKLNVEEVEEFEAWVQKYREAREGELGNPYRTLFLAAAADPVPIGTDMTQLDFTKVQSSGEVRIAACAKVHPAYAGFSEGLHGSSLSQGNLNEINRQFANTLMRPLWHNFANSMETIISTPENAELWYDDRDIPALQQDETDAAKVMEIQAATISSLITAGFDPESAVEAVQANDLSRLEHTGALSVQLYPGGQAPAPSQNGKQPDTVPATN
jgi:Phage portal protein